MYFKKAIFIIMAIDIKIPLLYYNNNANQNIFNAKKSKDPKHKNQKIHRPWKLQWWRIRNLIIYTKVNSFRWHAKKTKKLKNDLQ